MRHKLTGKLLKMKKFSEQMTAVLFRQEALEYEMMIKIHMLGSVATVVDSFSEGDDFYMITNCVKGLSLRQSVLSQGKVNLKEAKVR